MESRNSTESQADPPAGVGSSRNRTTADEGPAGVCSSWSRSGTTAGEGPAGASSSQSWTTADRPAGLVLEGTRLLQINTLDTVPPGAIRLRMGGSAGAGSLGDWTAVNQASGHATSSSGKEGSSAVKSSRAGAGPESLTTADSWAGVGSQSLTTAAISSGNRTSSGTSRAMSSESSPADPSPTGVEVTVDAGAGSPKNRSAADRPEGLPWGRIVQVKIRHSLLTKLRQLMELTQLTGAHQWTRRTVRLRPAVQQTRCGWSPWQCTPEAIQGHSCPLSLLPVAATCTAAFYPELSHWREFRPSHENATSSAYSVSSWRKYGGASCFRTDYGGFA